MKKLVSLLPALLMLALTPCALAAHTHAPTPSTWKLDLGKSDFGGGPALKSDMYRLQTDTDKWLKYTETEVDTDGKVWHTSWSGPQDGTVKPVIGMPGASYSVKTDDDSARLTLPDGTVINQWISMPDDKKTTVFKCDVKTRDGKQFHQTLVYNRVK
jgi:hypothetical protein